MAAPPVPGAIVFNLGDFMMRWSNDALKSTVHRVRAPSARSDDGSMIKERFSIPYERQWWRVLFSTTPLTEQFQFCSADLDKVIDALPGTW